MHIGRVSTGHDYRLLNLQHLVKIDDVPGELAALAALGVQLQPLLAALLPPLAEAHPAVSPHAPSGTYEPLLNGILDQVCIPDLHLADQTTSALRSVH